MPLSSFGPICLLFVCARGRRGSRRWQHFQEWWWCDEQAGNVDDAAVCFVIYSHVSSTQSYYHTQPIWSLGVTVILSSLLMIVNIEVVGSILPCCILLFIN